MGDDGGSPEAIRSGHRQPVHGHKRQACRRSSMNLGGSNAEVALEVIWSAWLGSAEDLVVEQRQSVDWTSMDGSRFKTVCSRRPGTVLVESCPRRAGIP